MDDLTGGALLVSWWLQCPGRVCPKLLEAAWFATSSCHGFKCRGCLGIFWFLCIALCFPMALFLDPNEVLRYWWLVVGRCIILISKHLRRPASVRRASCARDGCHSWSCTHFLGGNSNRNGGSFLFVALACMMSLSFFSWTARVWIPVQLGGVGVARDFLLPLVMWQYELLLLNMVLSRSCGAGLHSGVAWQWLAGFVGNLRAWWLCPGGSYLRWECGWGG